MTKIKTIQNKPITFICSVIPLRCIRWVQKQRELPAARKEETK